MDELDQLKSRLVILLYLPRESLLWCLLFRCYRVNRLFSLLTGSKRSPGFPHFDKRQNRVLLRRMFQQYILLEYMTAPSVLFPAEPSYDPVCERQ